MTEFAGNYEGPLYAPHPDIKRKFSMTDEQKLTFLLNELKFLAKETHCYDGKGGGDYYYPEDSLDCFEDGSKYGLVSFARAVLETMGEDYGE